MPTDQAAHLADESFRARVAAMPMAHPAATSSRDPVWRRLRAEATAAARQGEHPRAFTAFTLAEYARLALVAMRDLSLDPSGESELVAELARAGFVPAGRTRTHEAND